MADFEVVGMSPTDQQAWQAALGLPVTVASGTISSPVEYFDFTIPDGYKTFELEIRGLIIHNSLSSDGMVMLFGYDGTFVSDNSNADSYIYNGSLSLFGQTNSLVLYGTYKQLSLSDNQSDSLIPLDMLLKIYPGDSSYLTRMHITANSFDQGGGNLELFAGFGALNPVAVVTPTPARVTSLRLMPAGVFDNPPTSGETITFEYVLRGMVS